MEKPKNIQEYVVQKVIEHLKYKDAEFKELADALSRFNLVKCSFCKKYADFDNSCDGCDNVSCSKCKQIKNFQGYNLSGINRCKNCTEERKCEGWIINPNQWTIADYE